MYKGICSENGRTSHTSDQAFSRDSDILENLTDATQSVKLRFVIFAILLIDRSNKWWSGLKYRYPNGCLRAFLHPFMGGCGSENQARTCAPGSTMMEIYKTEPAIRAALYI